MKINSATTFLNETPVGVGVGQVAQGDKDTLVTAITTAQGVYDDRVNKTQGQVDATTTALEDAITTFQGKIIKAGDPSVLSTAINDTEILHENAVEGTAVDQYVVGSKATLKTAIVAAQSVLDDALNKTAQQLLDAKDALDQAVDVFENGKVKAGDATALTTAIREAATLHANAVEGIAVGQYLVGSKATLKAASDTAQLVLDHASNKTAQQLLDVKNALNQAVVFFDNSKVTALTGLTNVTITGTATDSSNRIALETAESLSLASSDKSIASVTEDPMGTIKVTGVAEGGPITITVQVTKDEVVTKTGTFTVTTLAAPPISITSKTITNFDFSTKYAGQATGQSKPMNTSDFQYQPKSFTINDGKGNIIPVNLTWDIPQNEYVKTPAASIGSAVESVIQDYFSSHGGLMNRTVTAAGNWNGSNQGDTFRIQSFQTGSTQSITLGGQDWEYFFDQQTYYGTNEDSGQNRTFTISDGTQTATIQLSSNFSTIDALVNHINSRLTNAGVQAQAEKVGATQFKITSTLPTGTIIIDGVNKAAFFE